MGSNGAHERGSTAAGESREVEDQCYDRVFHEGMDVRKRVILHIQYITDGAAKARLPVLRFLLCKRHHTRCCTRVHPKHAHSSWHALRAHWLCRPVISRFRSKNTACCTCAASAAPKAGIGVLSGGLRLQALSKCMTTLLLGFPLIIAVAIYQSFDVRSRGAMYTLVAPTQPALSQRRASRPAYC